MGESEPIGTTNSAVVVPNVQTSPSEHPRVGVDRKHLSLDQHAERSQAVLPEASTIRRTRAVSRKLIAVPFGLSAVWGDKRQDLALLDISNHGLKVRAPSGLDMQVGLPGRRISGISITLSGVEVLGGVQALVRRVSARDASNGGGYELGLELVSERRSKRSEGALMEFAKSDARIAEVMQEALRSGLSVATLDGATDPVLFVGGTVDTETGVLWLAALDSGLRGGDPVRVTCEVSGFNCSFFSSIVEQEGTRSVGLRLPRTVKMRRARNLHRLRPATGNRVEMKFRSPFDPRPFRTTVLEINCAGASFSADRTAIVLPLGTILDPIDLLFPDGRTSIVRGRVRSLSSTPGGHGEAPEIRYGLEFEALSDYSKELLSDDVVRSVRPSLSNTNGVTFDELWTFFEQSGFLYPEKLEQLKPQLPEIRETYARLLDDKQTQVLKTFLCKRERTILGHVSSLRLYRQTSYIQHIAVIRQPQSLFATEVLSLGMSEYLEQMPQFEWCRMYFRPNNRWPARVFGTYAKKLNDPGLSDLRTLAFCAGSTEAASPTLPPGSRIHRAQRSHLEQIQRYFLARGRVIALQSDDLSLDHLPMKEIEAVYSSNGLMRRREILVLEKDTSFLGFALLEISSPGLNLSELTNHFSVHVEEGGSDTRRALIAAARDRYRELGRKTCIALNDGDGVADFEAMGMPKHKEYHCWTGHRSLLRSYSEYVLGLFGRHDQV